MTLQASGPISLEDIQTEFGGSNPISIEEYYRGGVNVPVITETIGIPASGTISLEDFYGTSATSAFTVNLGNHTLSALDAFPGIRTLNTGQLQVTNVSGVFGNVASQWGTPITASIGSSYEVRVSSVSGGTLSGPAANTWHAMSSTRTWLNTAANTTLTMTMEIRLNGGAVQDSGSISLNYTTVGR